MNKRSLIIDIYGIISSVIVGWFILFVLSFFLTGLVINITKEGLELNRFGLVVVKKEAKISEAFKIER